MTTTVTVRCENEDCWKWFEPEPLEPTLRPADSDDPAARRRPPAGREAVCPHCGRRQPVPMLDF